MAHVGSEMAHLWVMRRVGAQGHIKELEELDSGEETKELTPEDATSHQNSTPGGRGQNEERQGIGSNCGWGSSHLAWGSKLENFKKKEDASGLKAT